MRRSPGQARRLNVAARRLDVNRTPKTRERMLTEMGWEGSTQDFLDLMEVAEGRLPGLERFRTDVRQHHVVAVQQNSPAFRGMNRRLNRATANLNAAWRRRGGEHLFTVSFE